MVEEEKKFDDDMDRFQFLDGDDGLPLVDNFLMDNMSRQSNGLNQETGGFSQPKAIPFITLSGANEDELEVSQEAMALLDQHQTRKIAVVAFTGTANTGKSLLANRYIRRNEGDGFQLRGPLG